MVANEIMNTPAMRTPYTLVIVYMIARPKVTTPLLINVSASIA